MLFDHTIFPSSGGYKQCSRTLSGSEEGPLPPSCGQLLNTSMVIVTYTHTVAVVCLLCTNDTFLHAYNYLYTYVKIRAYCIMLHLHFAAVFCYCIHHVLETSSIPYSLIICKLYTAASERLIFTYAISSIDMVLQHLHVIMSISNK